MKSTIEVKFKLVVHEMDHQKLFKKKHTCTDLYEKSTLCLDAGDHEEQERNTLKQQAE